jgi:ferric-dicitrate binding protein FerR (iron transport regulator)
MNSEQTWNLLAKFFSGEATSHEKELIEEWRNISEENQRVFELLNKIWATESDSESFKNVDVDKLWVETWDKANTQGFTPPKTAQYNVTEKKKEKKTAQVFQIGELYKYAAVAVFLLAIIFASIFFYPYQKGEFSESIVYKTEIGETMELSLEDGSIVLLAPKSTLDVSAGFNESNRMIELEGEAYFSVEGKQNNPFLVYTKNSVTKVLGTQFNVMALADENSLEVLVTEGTVSVEKGENDQGRGDIILKEGDLFQTDELLSEYEILSDVQKSIYLKWREGIIHFEDLNLSRIANQLERWYPVEIVLESENLAYKNLTAEFNASQPLVEILDAISLALNVEYTRNQKTVIIYE